MKKILIFALYLIACSSAQAQKIELTTLVSVGKAKAGPYKMAELLYAVSPLGDTLYNLSYRDKTYQTVEMWENVLLSGNDKDSFYVAVKDALAAEKNSERMITLSETRIHLVTQKSFGTKYVTVQLEKYKSAVFGLTDLTGAQLEKLYGK